MIRDFTLAKYLDLCEAILTHDYLPMTVYGYLSGVHRQGQQCAIFRHDIDRRIDHALRLAEVEAGLGISATYYFRYPSTFYPKIIGKIKDFGHEIGYHYEVLSKTDGDMGLAIDLFAQELAEFESVCEVHTICMHGGPLSRFDNRDLWKYHDYRDFGVAGEAYLSMVGTSFRYLTDTGRSWSGRNSIRDMLAGAGDPVPVETTDDLIRWIGNGQKDDLYLTVHPERWAFSDWDWASGYIKDIMMNAGKRMLVILR